VLIYAITFTLMRMRR